ncbi:anti-sigma factor domain-containing protein [Kutzneria sp. NPDC052558]|uniref:anti-sigma factor n=1 Tax=Kutzneria sp. NPDC052558 TaxID=3364121 RepID=UPI0037C7531F
MDAVRCPHKENAVGWALYALGPTEEHAVRQHLATCVECRRTVRETERVGALLAEAVPRHEPPPALRARLLAEISGAVPIHTAARRRHRGRALLAAAAAVVVVLGGATTVLGIQVSQLHAQVSADAMVQSIVGDPAARRAVLTNAGGKPAAMLIAGPQGTVVVPLGLAPNAANQHYVAWGLEDSGPAALTAFDVPAGSLAPIVVSWPASARALTRFAISLEPGRSMPAKPTDVVASGASA